MNISGFAFTVVVKGTVLRLAVDTDFRTAAAGGVGHRALTALLEALAAGILAYGRISSTHLDISSAAVHGIVIHTALCRTY